MLSFFGRYRVVYTTRDHRHVKSRNRERERERAESANAPVVAKTFKIDALFSKRVESSVITDDEGKSCSTEKGHHEILGNDDEKHLAHRIRGKYV